MSSPKSLPLPPLAPAGSITLVRALDEFGLATDPAWTGDELLADTAPEPSDDDLANQACTDGERDEVEVS